MQQVYIEVRPNGKKVLAVSLSMVKKTLRWFGEYPIVFLADARKKRDEAKVLLDQNLNPLEEKRKGKLSR